MTLSDRWQRSELAVFCIYLVSTALLWWGARFLYGSGSLWIGIFGLLLTATLFALANTVDGTSRWFRHAIIVFGLGLSFPLLFRGEVTIFTVGSFLAAVFLLEVTQWRVLQFRQNLRSVRSFVIARAVLPAFFTSVSLILAAAIVLSPLGTKIIENPFPEEFIRKVFSFLKPPPILQQYQQYLQDPLLRGQFGQIAGITLEEGDDYAALMSKLASRESRRLGEIHGNVFTLGFFLGAFGAMRVLALPFLWLSFLAGFVVQSLFRRMRLIGEVDEPTVRTVLRWK